MLPGRVARRHIDDTIPEPLYTPPGEKERLGLALLLPWCGAA
jgi:hypothetical protein